MEAKVFRVPMRAPDDIQGVAGLVESGLLRAEDVLCIMGKTEGNGCVNDFSRGFSNFVLSDYFAGKLGIPRREAEERISLIMSGGTEGAMSPHFTVFAAAKEGKPAGGKRLAFAPGHPPGVRPQEERKSGG